MPGTRPGMTAERERRLIYIDLRPMSKKLLMGDVRRLTRAPGPVTHLRLFWL
jgi:hypothetical protein